MARWFPLLLIAACGAPAPQLAGAPAPFEVALRPDNTASTDLYRFDIGDTVVTYGSPGGDFLIHYAGAGTHAVPGDDLDSSGVPDFVENVAVIYDDVLAHYRDDLGFLPPRSDAAVADNGGDGRFDVYLVDFAGIGDGVFRRDPDGCDPAAPSRCAGYMTQENDFLGYGYPSITVANRILASHELFHAVEAAYDADQNSVASEGCAVWGTESFDSSLDDFEGFIPGYLQNPDRSLDKPLPGPVDPFSYGAAIFFRFLGERYGNDAVRQLWEACVDGAGGVADPVWLEILDPMLQQNYGTTFADAFFEFARWNLYTGLVADPAVAYGDGAGYGSVAMTTEALPFRNDQLRVFYASSQYTRASTAGYTDLAVALAGPPEELADLRVWVSVRNGATPLEVTELTDLEGASQVFDASAATTLVVVVVNTAISGSSRRPGLCLGTPSDVAACHDAIDPPSTGGTGGSGGTAGAAGSAGTGGTGGSGGSGPPSGGCAALPQTSFGSMGLALVLLGWRRRRR